MLQDWDKVPFPEQEAPPLAGAGSEHVRVRLCVPDPQVAEQEVQDPHNAQFPFTDIHVFYIVYYRKWRRSLVYLF